MATLGEKQTLRERYSDEPRAYQLEYKGAIESQQYETTISGSDISYRTEKLARYAENSLLIH